MLCACSGFQSESIPTDAGAPSGVNWKYDRKAVNWKYDRKRSIERICKRHGGAGISVTSEAINDAIFHPDQHVRGPAAARFVDEGALRTVHFHDVVRAYEAGNREHQRGFPIDRLAKLPRLCGAHSSELEADFRKLLQIEIVRYVNQRARRLQQNRAVAGLNGISLRALLLPVPARAITVLHADRTRNLHRDRGAVQGCRQEKVWSAGLIEDVLQAGAINRHVEGVLAFNHELRGVRSFPEKTHPESGPIAGFPRNPPVLRRFILVRAHV